MCAAKAAAGPDPPGPTLPKGGTLRAREAPSAVLLSCDLIFTTKIRATAAELGYEVLVASSEPVARSLIEARQPQVVLVDLTAPGLAAPVALGAYQKLLRQSAWFVAFGPHVDVDALEAARNAGCQVVMPRSKFAAELPAILREYFSRPAPGDVRTAEIGV